MPRLLATPPTQVLEEAGFRYAYMMATSHFTARTAVACGFEQILAVPVESWLVDGKPCYQPTGPHTTWSVWLKPLAPRH